MARTRVVHRIEGIAIRHPAAHDETRFLELVRANAARLAPFAYPPSTPESYRAYVRGLRSPRRRGYLVCREGALDTPVGVVNLSEIVRGNFQSAYVGYYRLDGQPGAGEMTIGLALVVDHAFRRLKLHRLEANIQPENVASVALAKRAGFQREGFSPRYLKIGDAWRDHVRFALLAEDVLGEEAETDD